MTSPKASRRFSRSGRPTSRARKHYIRPLVLIADRHAEPARQLVALQVVILRLRENGRYAGLVVRLRIVPDLRQVLLQVVDLRQPLIRDRLLARRRLQRLQFSDRLVEDGERLVGHRCEIREVGGIPERLGLLVVLAADRVRLRGVLLLRKRRATPAAAAGQHYERQQRNEGCPPHSHYGTERG